MEKRVLVIDDDDAIRQRIADVLVQHGYAAVQAADGSEAFHEARAYRPDLIVLDLMMPAMTGWEFRSAQKEDPELATVPVIGNRSTSRRSCGSSIDVLRVIGAAPGRDLTRVDACCGGRVAFSTMGAGP